MVRLFKVARFAGYVIAALWRGRFAHAVRQIATLTPTWLFRFNKGFVLAAEQLTAPSNGSSACVVRQATSAHVDDIVQVNHMHPNHVRMLLSNGAVCFIAYYRNGHGLVPGAVLFRTSGRCYVRGMSWEHDFGRDGSYCFGVYTTPEARNRGLQSALVAAQLEYERQLGTRRFYRLLEFTNALAYQIAYNMGYRPIIVVYHMKILSLQLAITKSVRTGRAVVHFVTSSSPSTALHI